MAARKAVRIAPTKPDQPRNPHAQPSTSMGAMEKKKQTGFELPALSVFDPKKQTKGEKELERLKKKTIRRNAPQGEDMQGIRSVLRGMKGQEITVHEFVGLISPFTGDNGTILRTILASELADFRKLVQRVYDTMTQDVSDVLTNEHLQLSEVSKEKHAQYSDRISRAVDEVYDFCPDFNLNEYYTNPEYLNKLFPLEDELTLDSEEENAIARQEAYHRLMWLRSEGDRLAKENKKLQNRTRELKKQQQDQMREMAEIQEKTAMMRQHLEEEQDSLKEQLDEMNKSVERTMVKHEKLIREDEGVIPPAPAIRGAKKKLPSKSVVQAEKWNVKAAVEIESGDKTETFVAKTSKVSLARSDSSKLKKGAKRKGSRSRVPDTSQGTRDTSPFHYSPPMCLPCAGSQKEQTSPFHYSPPKSPPEAARESPPAPIQTTRVTTSHTVIKEDESRQMPRTRRGMAPQDTWRGFV